MSGSKFTVVVLLALALVGPSLALMPHIKARHFARKQQVLQAHADRLGIRPEDLPPNQWHTQQLDHFENANGATWLQRYFVNDTFFERPDGPVFLFIEGEGAANPLDALIGEHMELAAQYHALVLVVEHRYYGQSHPTADLTTPNMKYLSSQQALADLAQFWNTYAVPQYNLTEANTAICFGGSYPGALSSWFREKYPQVVFGAVASSAPVHAMEDFTHYNDVVHASLAASEVGGSDECVNNMETAFEAISKLITTPAGLSSLATQFDSCKPITTANETYTFVSNIAGNIQEIVQYNNELSSMPTIADICGYMTKSGQPLDNLAAMTKGLFTHGNCMDNNYADSIAAVMNTTVDPFATGVGIRQWTYQTCTQFGYYQTCEEGTDCPFPSNGVMSLAANLALCVDAFGISDDEVSTRIAFTNDYYGGSPPPRGTSNVLFVDGTIDPWHALSVLTPFSTASPTPLFVTGAAHCAWMMPSRPTDPAPLKAARVQVATVIEGWLAAAAENRA